MYVALILLATAASPVLSIPKPSAPLPDPPEGLNAALTSQSPNLGDSDISYTTPFEFCKPLDPGEYCNPNFPRSYIACPTGLEVYCQAGTVCSSGDDLGQVRCVPNLWKPYPRLCYKKHRSLKNTSFTPQDVPRSELETGFNTDSSDDILGIHSHCYRNMVVQCPLSEPFLCPLDFVCERRGRRAYCIQRRFANESDPDGTIGQLNAQSGGDFDDFDDYTNGLNDGDFAEDDIDSCNNNLADGGADWDGGISDDDACRGVRPGVNICHPVNLKKLVKCSSGDDSDSSDLVGTSTICPVGYMCDNNDPRDPTTAACRPIEDNVERWCSNKPLLSSFCLPDIVADENEDGDGDSSKLVLCSTAPQIFSCPSSDSKCVQRQSISAKCV